MVTSLSPSFHPPCEVTAPLSLAVALQSFFITDNYCYAINFIYSDCVYNDHENNMQSLQVQVVYTQSH